jgi:hypothetical protein
MELVRDRWLENRLAQSRPPCLYVIRHWGVYQRHKRAAPEQLKKSNLARLLRDEMDDAVMAEAERHAIEHDRQYYRRERIMFLAKDPV